MIYLNVPFAEKDQVKAAGAKWDRRAKKWYVPEGITPEGFQRWTGSPTPEDEFSPVKEFAQALKDHGLLLTGNPEMDGKWHRVAVGSDEKGQLSGSYRGFLDGVPSGSIMNYRSGDKAVKWVAAGRKIDPAELERQKKQAPARKEKQTRDLEDQYKQTAKRAYGIYTNAAPAPADHPYLQRKGIPPRDLRMDGDGHLLVPMRDEKGFLWNVQMIHPDGTKRYLKDSRKQGLMHVIKGKGIPTIIAEGYATSSSLHSASGHRVIVAFDAGNLEPVARTVREMWPKADLVIAADDDHQLEKETPPKPNTGLVRARQAAKAVDGRVIRPPLSSAEIAKGCNDYNDIRQARGSKALADILAEQLGTKKAKNVGQGNQMSAAMGL